MASNRCVAGSLDTHLSLVETARGIETALPDGAVGPAMVPQLESWLSPRPANRTGRAWYRARRGRHLRRGIRLAERPDQTPAFRSLGTLRHFRALGARTEYQAGPRHHSVER